MRKKIQSNSFYFEQNCIPSNWYYLYFIMFVCFWILKLFSQTWRFVPSLLLDWSCRRTRRRRRFVQFVNINTVWLKCMWNFQLKMWFKRQILRKNSFSIIRHVSCWVQGQWKLSCTWVRPPVQAKQLERKHINIQKSGDKDIKT